MTPETQRALENFEKSCKEIDELQELVRPFIAIGVPKELARLPVPVARYSRMRASANLRNWLGFLTLRMAPGAQWEIREYANAVGELVASQFPRTWELFEKGRANG
jgi:thymidylate synthase (FAD)